MKRVVILLLILGGIFASIPKSAISNENRYNKCYQIPPKVEVPRIEYEYVPVSNGNGWRAIEATKTQEKNNLGWICETDSKVCYLMTYGNASPTLLYCENK